MVLNIIAVIYVMEEHYSSTEKCLIKGGIIMSVYKLKNGEEVNIRIPEEKDAEEVRLV